MHLNTFLNFGGNCQEAFRFYEKHLGGKIIASMTWGQTPDHSNMPKGYENKLVYCRMTLGATDIMGSDVPPEIFQPMRSAYLSLAVDSSLEAERVHNLLSEGGQVFMPMQETFFAHRFSMLRDKFGTSWMVIHERPASAAA